jgi:hypothetical protein
MVNRAHLCHRGDRGRHHRWLVDLGDVAHGHAVEASPALAAKVVQ